MFYVDLFYYFAFPAPMHILLIWIDTLTYTNSFIYLFDWGLINVAFDSETKKNVEAQKRKQRGGNDRMKLEEDSDN